MNENRVIKIGTVVIKIFLIGLLLQFFVQTFVTYRLFQTGGLWNVLWMWKEIILLAIFGFLSWILRKRRILEARRKTLPIKDFVLIFCITLGLAFLISLFVNHSGLGITIMSLRYSMMGFFIFIVFFALSYLFFGTREIQITKWYTNTIKTLLILSIIRWGCIWLVPNLMRFVGYDHNNYEGGMGIAPPAAYYTQYDNGYVRNQFIFERPISRGFFLVAFWPLFFLLCIKGKPLQDRIVRGSLYGLSLMSTFSRAAWIAWVVQIIILVLMQMDRKSWKLALYGFLPLFLVFGTVTYIGRDQIITREFSNTGHFRLVLNAFQRIAEKPFWGQGAGFAGPASQFLGEGKAYNPENQYLQIWLEYGVLGFAGRLYLYRFLHWIGYKAYMDEKNEKHKIIKKTRQYGILIFAFSLGVLGLSIEGLVLHSFVDRMIVYPFMALFGITYALYLKSLNRNHE